MPKTDKTGSLKPIMTAEIPIIGTESEKSRDHLWKPGVSPNPGGRPKALVTQAMIKAFTPEKATEFGEMVVRKALAGDFKWAEMLVLRIEGKPVDRKITSDDPNAFNPMEQLETDTLLSMIHEISRRQSARTSADPTPTDTQSHDSPAT